MRFSFIPAFLFAYILSLFQTSFFVHFMIFGIILNFCLLALILVNLFEKKDGALGLWFAFFLGIFLDIFSGRFPGFYILLFVAVAIFVKFVFLRYVRIPFVKRA